MNVIFLQKVRKHFESLVPVLYGKNKHTSWYVFFKTSWENGEEIYKVRYIANNHSVAQHL